MRRLPYRREQNMKRVAFFLLSAALVGGLTAIAVGIPSRDSEAQAIPVVPSVPSDRPLTILVKGWLWDASTRGSSWAPINDFQPRVNQVLQTNHGYSTKLFEYPWSRLPSDVFDESKRFTVWATQFSKRSEDGRCVNFVGHSAGAAFVYRAASQGVPMGFMGTLGLPTFGQGRPAKVRQWTNFFTSSHPDDFAGRIWGSTIAADQNVDIGQEHRRFWTSPEVAQTSADGIARAWKDCRMGIHDL